MFEEVDEFINKLSESQKEEISKYMLKKRIKQTLAKMNSSPAYIGQKRDGILTGKITERYKERE